MAFWAMAAVSSWRTLAARPIYSPETRTARLRKKSRPLRPMSSNLTSTPGRSAWQRCAPLLRLVLKERGRWRVWGLRWVASDGGGDVAQDLAQHRAVGTGADGAILRAAQFRRRDHLHGLGDLLRVFDRADAPPDIDQTRHVLRATPPGPGEAETKQECVFNAEAQR